MKARQFIRNLSERGVCAQAEKRGINLEGVLDDGFNKATDIRDYVKSGRLRKFGISLAIIASGEPYMPKSELDRILDEFAVKYHATADDRIAANEDEDVRIVELDTQSFSGNVISIRVVTSRGSELPFAHRTLRSLSVRERFTGDYDCEPLAEESIVHRVVSAIGRVFGVAA